MGSVTPHCRQPQSSPFSMAARSDSAFSGTGPIGLGETLERSRPNRSSNSLGGTSRWPMGRFDWTSVASMTVTEPTFEYLLISADD